MSSKLTEKTDALSLYREAARRLLVVPESGLITRKKIPYLKKELHGTCPVRYGSNCSPFITIRMGDAVHKISPLRLVWFVAFGELPHRVYSLNNVQGDFRISNLATNVWSIVFETRGRHSLIVEETRRVRGENMLSAINNLLDSFDVLAIVSVLNVGNGKNNRR